MNLTEKTYPDQTVERAARAAGAQVMCLWQVTGPVDTQIAWLEALLINRSICIVQTFIGGGWDAYTSAQSNRADDTLVDVLNRCKVPVPVPEKIGG